ncbi:MAG: GNAT family N-acetyltransferase [Cryomorphaceae bacterium]|nr:GNAT family N-acetyltransferase [Cryomorphaceae bacterium]
MKKEILLKEENHAIVRYLGLPNHAVDFWNRIAWGTEGAIYQNMKVREKISKIANPTLMAIEKDEVLQATALFSNVSVLSENKSYNCQYIRFFATDPAIRGTGLMKRYASKVMSLIREDETLQTIYFALVEKGNKASFHAVKNAGYSHTGTIKTIGFSRFFPKFKNQLFQVQSQHDKSVVMAALSKQYAQHSLTNFNPVFLHNQYYVLKDKDGNILAGCQYHLCEWKVNRLPGIGGDFTLKLLPYLPLFNRIFNPKKFRFLTFEAIFCKPGNEDCLNDLMEGLLALNGINSAMLWVDEKDPFFETINRVLHFGLIHNFVKSNDVYMMQSFSGFSEEEQKQFTGKPFYASAFDYA